ncbi:hypothetical protein [Flavobacterium aciduliphilum]|uniref:Uncharacterized protein n=1 Tax=Flavobacterium aciduliphilum TaxID=1101402 RepID=A0A328YG54_9FLAO|nr:hypothetical protein [Flavobacterium aciduliphilum]RAR71685.1 hypothetical protein CLV55_10633 [Flavobacterium aciduliphilum]
MKLFEFIYYCIYKPFVLIKRVGVREEQLVAGLYSGMLFLNTVMMFMLLSLFISLKFIPPLPRESFRVVLDKPESF